MGLIHEKLNLYDSGIAIFNVLYYSSVITFFLYKRIYILSDIREKSLAMKIKVNDKEVQFTGATLFELVNEHGFRDKSGIAVAVNETVIPRSEWQNYLLDQNDAVLIIIPAQGG